MRFSLVMLLSLAVPATARDLSLVSPIDCDLNGPCYIQQYVDHDPSKDASDFSCAGLSYDGHKGTDFALPTYDMIAKGVDVLAAASGTVVGTRDGMTDERYASERAAEIEGRECGNGVVLRHPDGWETQYCHMRMGSVLVTKGEQVSTGDVLGQVGMSGRAEFAHLHLSVRHNGKVIDPFDPDGSITCGKVETDTLWSEPPLFRAGGIVALGISATVPEFSDIRANTVIAATVTSEALVIYAFLFGTQKGDIIRLSLRGPDGVVAERDTVLKRNHAQSFRAIGKKLKTARWTAGQYTGQATLSRGGEIIDTRDLTMTLP